MADSAKGRPYLADCCQLRCHVGLPVIIMLPMPKRGASMHAGIPVVARCSANGLLLALCLRLGLDHRGDSLQQQAAARRVQTSVD
jgi:hypothetical protein